MLLGLWSFIGCADDTPGTTDNALLTSESAGDGDGDGDSNESGETMAGDGDGDPTGDGDGDPGDGDGDPTGDGDGDPTGDGDGDGDDPCTEGEVICEDGQALTCDDMGGWSDPNPCADECADGLGCVLCIPNSHECQGDISFTCLPDGSAWEADPCDALQGVMCNPNSGMCEGACAPEELGLSYIGCDYYPTVTPGLRENNPWVFNYAVVVANTTNDVAEITVTRGPNMVTQQQIGPNTAQAITLPYVDALTNPNLNQAGPSVLVQDGAYRLRSTQPVTVYQFNPLEYQIGNQFSFINDAGLLFPVNTWRQDVRVVSRNHWYANNQFHLPGFYAVTAMQDGTMVTITPSATGAWVIPGGGVAADGTGQVMLDEGDVLEVFTAAGQPNAFNSDLTGTLIEASAPIQVIGGHKCTNVPQNVTFCDRLEESIPPLDTVAKVYLVTAPLIPTGGNVPKAQIVRITATEDDTDLIYDPPQNGAPTNIASAGGWVELAQSAASYEVSSSKKILVSQYMLGQSAGGNSGDPAMTMAVPTEQFRASYLVHAPTNYEYSYANIVAANGAAITVDGMPVAGFQMIGNTGYSVARVTLSNNGDGNHTATGGSPFGISVYGYGQYTSYWYPGGLNLELIPQ
ncbi:BNR repeat domain protein [Enhygromyxa salina]|uniref:BNR repeat domain protein n=1 Tax=Enhygromyxa salina TaxID=215803 RepID=A0A0C2DCB6_9BACT|nr:BNR repeat domain protein [Enhygromyxa salina]